MFFTQSVYYYKNYLPRAKSVSDQSIRAEDLGRVTLCGMTIDIATKNITLDEPLRVFIEDKIGGLEKYLKNAPASARVEIGKPSRHHRSGFVFYAEGNLKVGGRLLRAHIYHNDLRAAIVDVKDDLKNQIKKFKEKNSARRQA